MVKEASFKSFRIGLVLILPSIYVIYMSETSEYICTDFFFSVILTNERTSPYVDMSKEMSLQDSLFPIRLFLRFLLDRNGYVCCQVLGIFLNFLIFSSKNPQKTHTLLSICYRISPHKQRIFITV